MRSRYKLDSCVLPWALHDGKKKGTEEAVSVFVLDVAAGARERLWIPITSRLIHLQIPPLMKSMYLIPTPHHTTGLVF